MIKHDVDQQISFAVRTIRSSIQSFTLRQICSFAKLRQRKQILRKFLTPGNSGRVWFSEWVSECEGWTAGSHDDRPGCYLLPQTGSGLGQHPLGGECTHTYTHCVQYRNQFFWVKGISGVYNYFQGPYIYLDPRCVPPFSLAWLVTGCNTLVGGGKTGYGK